MGTASGPAGRAAIITGRGGALAVALMLGACAQSLEGDTSPLALSARSDPTVTTGSAPQSELARATEYWGREHAKSPRDLKAALSYARNLKAMGHKPQALSVLQSAAIYHGDNRELASEYGRLALELEQVALAAKILAMADDPARPDWRVVSARGAAHAKQGEFAESIPHFERALTLSPANPSIQNNLAMSFAASGQPDRAEGLLKSALAARPGDKRIRQNLAIVLGLQGRYDEAKSLGAGGDDATALAENVDLVRQMARVEPKPTAQFADAKPAPAAAATATPARPQKVAATTVPEDPAEAIIRRAMAADKARETASIARAPQAASSPVALKSAQR